MRRWWTNLAGAGLAGASLMAATVIWPGAVAGGASPPEEEHCVLAVIGQAPDGQLLTAPMVCQPSRAAALAGARALAPRADWPIGTHYDGASFTGSSVTVVGADCTGGWLNLPGTWNDRISSTLHGCPRIKHHLHVNLTGASQTTLTPGGNLGGTLNNEVSSIQYLP